MAEVLSSLDNIEHEFSILILDDSSRDSFKEKNEFIASNCRYETHYVNDETFDKYVDRLVTESKNLERPNILEKITIGRDEWDIPSGRRARQLLCHAAFSNDNYLFLDGDYRATPDTDLSPEFDEPLIGMQVKGSFDLSRVQWIFVCNRLAELESSDTKFTRLRSKIEKAYKSDYIENIIDDLTPEEIRTCIGRYTDLLPAENSNIRITFPNENYLSGGAFACSSEAVGIGYFPDWYGEDGVWFSDVVNELNIGRPKTDTSFFHNPGKKKILDRESIERETVGMFLLVAAIEYNQQGEIGRSRLEKLRRTRIERLQEEKDCAARLDGFAGNLDEAIEWAILHLESMNLEAIETRLHQYKRDQYDWTTTISKIKQGGVKLDENR
ncbi:hypothetical protein NJ7G_3904 [Natrinema sp. J7-2]|nr:hypothetical protein NJ7G_3904 [Natrinema sp. J7-2]